MAAQPEDLLRSFELRVQEQTERALQLSQRMQQSTTMAESPGGEVRVTVDSTGGLADLRFGRPAERLPLDRLAELVLATSRQAQARMAAAMGDLVTQMYGADSPTTRLVVDAYAERFPTAPGRDGGERR